MMVRDFAVSNPSAHLSITESAFAHPAGQPQSLLGRKSYGTGDWRGLEQLHTFLGHGDVRLRGLLAMAMGMVDLTFSALEDCQAEGAGGQSVVDQDSESPTHPNMSSTHSSSFALQRASEQMRPRCQIR